NRFIGLLVLCVAVIVGLGTIPGCPKKDTKKTPSASGSAGGGDTAKDTGDTKKETGDTKKETGDTKKETGDTKKETGDTKKETKKESGSLEVLRNAVALEAVLTNRELRG